MRHRKSGRKLKRTASHRRATLGALSTALLQHKRITTTLAKAKETRVLVEKLITKAKRASAQADKPAVAIHARRQTARLIKDRSVVAELFSTVLEKIADRPGGYTRIVKLGQRSGDNAEMAVIELVDFNTGQAKEKTTAPAKKKAALKKKKSGKAKPSEGAPASAHEAKEAKKESKGKES
jgi:large subunit ribosomal protein L17